MLEAVRYGLSNYVNFQGRTGRATFWWWVLAVFLFSFALALLDEIILGGGSGIADTGPLQALGSLALLLPNLAMAVRRLHDIGRSGWWVLIGIIPIVGWLVLIYWYCQPSREPAPDTAQDPLVS